MHRSQQTATGFTIIELLLVMGVIGVLSSIALPQFIGSSQDAKASSILANLQIVDEAVERYYHQHSGTYPGSRDAESGKPDAADPEASFFLQLTGYTDKNGRASLVKDRGRFPYGPYLMEVPVNAALRNSNVNVVASAGPMKPDMVGKFGWKFSTVTGQLLANGIAELVPVQVDRRQLGDDLEDGGNASDGT